MARLALRSFHLAWMSGLSQVKRTSSPGTQRETETETETERQRDRETERQRDRETERQTACPPFSQRRQRTCTGLPYLPPFHGRTCGVKREVPDVLWHRALCHAWEAVEGCAELGDWPATAFDRQRRHGSPFHRDPVAVPLRSTGGAGSRAGGFVRRAAGTGAGGASRAGGRPPPAVAPGACDQ